MISSYLNCSYIGTNKYNLVPILQNLQIKFVFMAAASEILKLHKNQCIVWWPGVWLQSQTCSECQHRPVSLVPE